MVAASLTSTSSMGWRTHALHIRRLAHAMAVPIVVSDRVGCVWRGGLATVLAAPTASPHMLLHELSHATALERGRPIVAPGGRGYGAEEVIADVAADRLCRRWGLPVSTEHEEYIAGWMPDSSARAIAVGAGEDLARWMEGLI